ncbi:MAG TPA: MtnX-like HAD-IB family phosphatase [Dehalococcoidia bacterium]|nr:MtnX-like HAD-IB family phosphatase [Dehalococcoidia bacterium]
MKERKTLVQCDFDGTITIEDASFTILDAYIPGEWQSLFEKYQQGKMTVGEFNSTVFTMVKADKETLLEIIREKISVREGFRDLMEYCRLKDYRFVIVSNGLDFYIEDILGRNGFTDVEVHASNTIFGEGGLIVRHRGPDGHHLDTDVKAAYTDYFRGQGYRIIYLGDGRSDVTPARKSHYIFATDSLVEYCKTAKISCTPFTDFHQVIQVMESW